MQHQTFLNKKLLQASLVFFVFVFLLSVSGGSKEVHANPGSYPVYFDTANPMAQDWIEILTGSTKEINVITTEALGVTCSLVEGDVAGILNSPCTYVATTTPGIYHIKMTSNANPDKFLSLSVVVGTSAVSISPIKSDTTASSTVQFSYTVEGDPVTGLMWSVKTQFCNVMEMFGCRVQGTIDDNGLYTASDGNGSDTVCLYKGTPSMSPAIGTNKHYVCTLVTTLDGVTYIGDTGTPAVDYGGGGPVIQTVSIIPSSLTISAGGTADFDVKVLSFAYSRALWSILEGSTGGSIYQKNEYGPIRYTAPLVPGIYHLEVSNNEGSAEAVITVVPNNRIPIVVSISPENVMLYVSATSTASTTPTQQFTASVQNSVSNMAVTWSILEPNGGSITSDGLYTAPLIGTSTASSTYHVLATSVADTTKVSTSTVEVVLVLPKKPSVLVVPEKIEVVDEKVEPVKKSSSVRSTAVATTTATTSSLVATSTESAFATTTSTPIVVSQVSGGSTVVKQVVQVANTAAEAIKTPTGSTVVNSVSTVGAVTGFSVWTMTSFLASPMFTTPVAASEIFFVPLRLLGLTASALGLRRRRRPWGTVYDSVTKMPIDPALVTLYDESGKKISNSITDLDGRFGFIVPKGKYHLKVQKTNYAFPSTKLSHKNNDELYSNLYFGEPITVGEDGSVIQKNIPMDPKKFDWNEFTKNKMGIMQFHSLSERLNGKISNFIFWFGFVVGIISVFIIPHLYSISILSLYVILIIVRSTEYSKKSFGSITDSANHPLSFAAISIYSKDLHRELFKKVADQYGRYYALVPKGEYEIKISRKNPDESYTEVYTEEVNAKRGVINGGIRV